MTPMTPLIVAISFAAGGLATLAIFQLVRPVLGGRMVWPAISAAILTTVLTTLVGTLTDVARTDYLLGLSAFTLPVLVLLEAAAIGAGSDARGRWILMLAWGLVVFPGAALLPLALTDPCRTTGCGFTDFGGALPLFASASAYVLLARNPADTAPPPFVRGTDAIAAVLGFWVMFAIWLASLEADLDAYIPRILLAGVVGPVAGACGWLLVDRLKAVERSAVRSLGFGFLAGIAATASGAVIVSFPWTAVVAVLAGMAAALIHSSRALARGGVASRWGFTLLGATAMGFLAPPVWGDAVGILFSAEVGVLTTPLMAITSVAVGAVVVSAPVWLLLIRRRRAA
jgi:hypothetical protein